MHANKVAAEVRALSVSQTAAACIHIMIHISCGYRTVRYIGADTHKIIKRVMKDASVLRDCLRNSIFARDISDARPRLGPRAQAP